MALSRKPKEVGILIRRWREHRRFSQLSLALDVGVSARHLSFIETGKARPSRELILRLAGRLNVPHRERNIILSAAGFAAEFKDTPLTSDIVSGIRGTIRSLLDAMEPSPALVVNRHWEMVDCNRMVPPLLEGIPDELLRPPVNVVRLALHKRGLASRIQNLRQWTHQMKQRLQRDVEASADPRLIHLLEELRQTGGVSPEPVGPVDALVVPLVLESPFGLLSLLSTTTVFGTAADVTLSELAIEAFHPADEVTRLALTRRARKLPPRGALQPI